MGTVRHSRRSSGLWVVELHEVLRAAAAQQYIGAGGGLGAKYLLVHFPAAYR